MAIIACKECTREVSDKAASCPHCGVSISGAAQRQPRRAKPWLFGTLIAGLLTWAALTTLWLTGTIVVPKQIVDFIGAGRGSARIVKTDLKTAEQVSVIPTVQSALELKPGGGAVYLTSVEQLYQDYDANEVAIQNKIGDSAIRITGGVAEISEDTAGHPVVTLHTGSDNGADMVLAADQRNAAAQIAKEDTVEIQCNKMQRIAARLHGSGCALMLVDAGAKQLVYLAVLLSGGKAGNAPLYIVGPMSRKTCLTSSDTIAVQVTSNPRSERILSKSCGATARESVSLDGCHLSSTMSAIPDIPTAHLWKYDCMAPAAEARKTAEAAPSRGRLIRTAAPAETEEIATLPTPASAVAISDDIAPAPKLDTSLAIGIGAAPTTVDPGEAGGSSQLPTPAALPSSVPTAPPPPVAIPDDLASVRAKDPDAADRMVSYCGKITSGASDPTTAAARCRRDELDAWTRLTVQNEFPTLDAASRQKCNQPPFPDSFVARESCAKFQLHLD
jgi:hypothetical protein